MEFDRNKLKENAKKAMSKLKANIKEIYYDKADIPSASVQQMADFIRQSPDTQVSTKKLLGNTYRFFNLKINDDYFYLETNNDRILQLDGFANGKKLVSYRSYRDIHQLHTPIKLT
jgi:chromosome segregation ATPase